ncbi:MAG: HypC/HybG/HupF family hydrogenase formation chaperone [Anaerolineae bacterium]|nr:HypC/HybG/HupF family hydrogenase formation chaperone [Anaerolineae bacterium]
MCLGIPAKITEIYERDGQTMSMVDFGGVSREVCLDFVMPQAQVGSWVIVHVGFAISVLDEQEAQETLALLREIEGELTANNANNAN